MPSFLGLTEINQLLPMQLQHTCALVICPMSTLTLKVRVAPSAHLEFTKMANGQLLTLDH